MNDQHTPGPWLSSRFGFQVVTGDSWSTICELKTDAVWEGSSAAASQEHPWSIQEANARLIAAAPTLLEALRNAVLSLDANAACIRRGGFYAGPMADALERVSDQARAAIAAATQPPQPEQSHGEEL